MVLEDIEVGWGEGRENFSNSKNQLFIIRNP